MPALAASDVMQVFVKTIEGVTITLQVQSSMTVAEVMTMIQGKSENIRVKSRLSYGSVNMLDHSQLSDYKVEPNSTLFEDGRVRGGSDVDENMAEADFNIKNISDVDIAAESLKRPAVMDMVAAEMLKLPGFMDKMIASWSPTLPNVPDINDKRVHLLTLV